MDKSKQHKSKQINSKPSCMDGKSYGVAGGESVGLGRLVGRTGTLLSGGFIEEWGVAAVAPDFALFAGKEWESTYPDVLREFYRALGGRGGNGPGGYHDKSVFSDSAQDGGGGGDCGDVGILRGSVLGGTGICGSTEGDLHGRVLSDGQSGSLSDGTHADHVGGVSVVERGVNYWRNKKKRERARERRVREAKPIVPSVAPWRSVTVERKQGVGNVSYFSELPAECRKGLKESYAERLKAENDLKSFRAKQQLELERAKDMTQLKKRQETFLMSQTEMNKVRAEKAFATLAQTDNVPGVVGSAKTITSSGVSTGVSPVFSGVGSGTISPNSSISLAEIHALQKRELENAHKVEKLEARLEKLKLLQPGVYKDLGFLHALPPTVGTGVTVDENGSPIGDYGDGFDGYLGKDGRFHFGENYDNY